MGQSYLAPVNCKASSLSDPEIRTEWTQPGSLRILRRGLSMWAKAFLAPPSALVREPAPASLQLKTLSAERELQLPFVHPLSGRRDFTVSMHPDIQTVRVGVKRDAHSRYAARRGDFHYGRRPHAFGSHQSLPVVRRA